MIYAPLALARSKGDERQSSRNGTVGSWKRYGRRAVSGSRGYDSAFRLEVAAYLERPDRMHVLITGGMGDYQLSTMIAGILHSERVARVTLVRRWALRGGERLHNVTPGPVGRLTGVWELWRAGSFARALSTAPVDVAVIYHLWHTLLSAPIARLRGVPYVIVTVGSDVHLQLPRLPLRIPYRSALSHAAAVVVLGSRSAELVAAAGAPADRIHRIPNYQDESRFSPGEPEKSWDLVFVGRLVKVKQAHRLVAATARARQRLRDLRVAIVGDGPERPSLEKLARRLGVADGVRFVGYDPQPERYLRAARAVILTSRSEGLPASALEGMLCGIPAIVPDVGDVRDVFTDRQNALIVPPDDDAALDEAIFRLLTDGTLYDRLCRGALETREEHLRRSRLPAVVAGWEKALLEARGG